MSIHPNRSLVPLAIALIASLSGCKSKPASEDAAGNEAKAEHEPAQIDGHELDIDPRMIKKVEFAGPSPKARSRVCAAPEGDWYLHLSDIHLGATVTTQEPKGDTSAQLWQATKAALREKINGSNPPKFIVYTGDLPDHDPDHGDTHTANIKAALADLRAIAGSIPLIYLPGNNDSLDWDYASYSSADGQTPLSVAGWSGPTLNVPSTGAPAQGYASASPVKGLRVLALNTVMFSASYPCSHAVEGNAAACADHRSEEVAAQLQWVGAELEAAAEAGEKVLLAMHIPPGIDAYSSPKTMWEDSSWRDEFLGLIDRSPAEIVGLAYGHTHLDELRRLYDAGGELELIALSAPGITPGHGNNPGFKAVSYGDDFVIQDALTWYASASGPEAVDFAYGKDDCYRYSEVFGCGPGQSLVSCLGARETCDLDAKMATIYTVKRSTFEPGTPGYYATAPGIEVRPGDAAPASCTK